MQSPSLHEQYMRAVVAERLRSPSHGPPGPRRPRPRARDRLRRRLAFALATAARRIDEPTTRRALRARETR
jgi:hypothetical protein